MSLIADLHVRVTQEELAALRAIGARKQAPPAVVVRAMARHFLLLWAKGEDVVTELGSISWGKQG